MHRWIKVMVICLSGLLWFAGNGVCGNKVVIVPGLSEKEIVSVSTYVPFFQGLEQVLGENNVVSEYYYVGLDSASNDEARMALGKEAIDKIKAINPDVVIAVNDNVVKFVAMQIKDIPVVSGFIYGSPAALGLPTPNITGVARGSYAVDIWSMAKQLSGASSVSMLSKNSFSMAQIRSGLLAKIDLLEKLSGVRMREMYLCDTLDEWKKYVENWSEDLIYLADVSRIKDGDREISAAELVRWTVDHAKVPVVAANEEAVKDGALFAIVTSEEIWGKQVGDLVMKVLNGTPVSEIPMETVTKGKLLINAKTAMEKKIMIPYEILNSADQVFE